MIVNNSVIQFKKCELKSNALRILRHIPIIDKRKITPHHYGAKTIMRTEDGRNYLKTAIIDKKPFMAARFGTSEGLALVNYWKIVLKKGDLNNFPKKYLNIMCNNAGFFPNDCVVAGNPAKIIRINAND